MRIHRRRIHRLYLSLCSINSCCGVVIYNSPFCGSDEAATRHEPQWVELFLGFHGHRLDPALVLACEQGRRSNKQIWRTSLNGYAPPWFAFTARSCAFVSAAVQPKGCGWWIMKARKRVSELANKRVLDTEPFSLGEIDRSSVVRFLRSNGHPKALTDLLVV